MDLTKNFDVLNFPFSNILPIQPVKYCLPRIRISKTMNIKKLQNADFLPFSADFLKFLPSKLLAL